MKKKIKNYSGRNFQKNRTPDKLTIKKRSFLMAGIRSKNTKFEQNFIMLLKKNVRQKFNTHDKKVRGTPDIVFSSRKVCVFLDSDFWHGWHYPRWKHLLKDDFWRKKIENNRKRDRKITRTLRAEGWRVIRIWEHQIKADNGKIIKTVSRSLVRRKISI